MSTLYWKWDKAIKPKRCKEIIQSAGDTFENASLGDDSADGTRLDDEVRKTLIHWSEEQDLFDMVNSYEIGRAHV